MKSYKDKQLAEEYQAYLEDLAHIPEHMRLRVEQELEIIKMMTVKGQANFTDRIKFLNGERVDQTYNIPQPESSYDKTFFDAMEKLNNYIRLHGVERDPSGNFLIDLNILDKKVFSISDDSLCENELHRSFPSLYTIARQSNPNDPQQRQNLARLKALLEILDCSPSMAVKHYAAVLKLVINEGNKSAEYSSFPADFKDFYDRVNHHIDWEVDSEKENYRKKIELGRKGPIRLDKINRTQENDPFTEINKQPARPFIRKPSSGETSPFSSTPVTNFLSSSNQNGAHDQGVLARISGLQKTVRGLSEAEEKGSQKTPGLEQFSENLRTYQPNSEVWKPKTNFAVQLVKAKLEEEIEINKGKIKALKAGLIEFANKKPVDQLERLHRKLSVQAGTKKELTVHDLNVLYVKGDAAAYQELNPSLTDQEVIDLAAETEAFLIKATQQQKRKRALKLINKMEMAKNPEVRSQLAQKISEEWTGIRNYVPSQNPEMLVFEYRCNISLKEKQVGTIRTFLATGDFSCLIELIMGYGKTMVLLPLLALRMADGVHLSMIILPSSLFDSVAPFLKERVRKYYERFSQSMNWKDTSLKNLTNIYQRLEKMIKRREFLLGVGKELQFFDLDIRSLRKDYVDALNEHVPEDTLTELKKRIEMGQQILNLLREKGTGIFDEVHDQLNCNTVSLKAVGEPAIMDKQYINISTALFNVLFQNKDIRARMQCDLYKTASPTVQPFTEKLYRESKPGLPSIIELIADNMLEPQILQNLDINVEQQHRGIVLQYLLTPHGTGIVLPQSMSLKDKHGLWFLRQQLQVVLPLTLSQSLNVNYGFFPEGPGGTQKSKFAGPFYCANEPQLGSQFAHPGEGLNYTFQAYHQEGLPARLLSEALDQIKDNVLHEKELNGYVSIQETEAYEAFKELIGLTEEEVKAGDEKYSLLKMSWDQKKQLAKEISEDPERLNRLLQLYVLPSMKRYDQYVSADGLSLVDMIKRPHGLSGTIAKDLNTFSPQFLPEHTKLDQSIGPKTIHGLAKTSEIYRIKKAEILPEDEVKQNGEVEPKQKLEQKKMFRQMLGHFRFAQLRALIDTGAIFKDLSGHDMAKIVLEWAERSKQPINAVVYFEKDTRMIFKKHNTQPTIHREGNDVDPNTRFTIYDQKHCTGVDVDQDPTAIALQTLNRNNTFQELSQGAWRMRELHRNQTVILAPADEVFTVAAEKLSKPKGIDNLDIAFFTYMNQLERQAEDVRKAFRLKLENIVRRHCQRALDGVVSDQLIEPMHAKLHSFTVTKIEDDLQIGQVEELQQADKVLNQEKADILKPIIAWHQECQAKNPVLAAKFDIAAFRKEMDDVVQKTLAKKVISGKIPASVNAMLQSRINVEVSVSVKVKAEATEKAKQNQRQRQQEQTRNLQSANQRKVDQLFPYKKWQILPPSDPNCFVTIKNLKDFMDDKEKCNPIIFGKHAMQFAGLPLPKNMFTAFLKISFNLAFSEPSKKPFNGARKPKGPCLVRQDVNDSAKVEFIMLSQVESDEWSERLSKLSAADWGPFRSCLYWPSTGVYQQSANPITDPRITENPTFVQLDMQAKFIMGDTRNYNTAKLLEWIGKYSPEEIEAIEKVFVERFLPAGRTYEGTKLWRVFRKLEKDNAAKKQVRSAAA